MTTESNYACSISGGESKLAQIQKLSDGIKNAGCGLRKSKEIQKWEKLYCNAATPRVLLYSVIT
jgi:hypothetical protein